LHHNVGDADAALAIFFTSSKSSLDATHHGATLGTKSSGFSWATQERYVVFPPCLAYVAYVYIPQI
jgi:hypothetical protein